MRDTIVLDAVKPPDESFCKEHNVGIQEDHSYRHIFIDPLLALKMGLVSLAKFGALDDFLKWVRS